MVQVCSPDIAYHCLYWVVARQMVKLFLIIRLFLKALYLAITNYVAERKKTHIFPNLVCLFLFKCICFLNNMSIYERLIITFICKNYSNKIKTISKTLVLTGNRLIFNFHHFIVLNRRKYLSYWAPNLVQRYALSKHLNNERERGRKQS